MKTKLTLFVAVIAIALFGAGCASTKMPEDSELLGQTWMGYWTDGGAVLGVRLDKEGEEYVMQRYYPDHKIQSGKNTLKIYQITGDEIIFLVKGEGATEFETSEEGRILTAKLIRNGERLVNGARYDKGKLSNISFSLIRSKNRNEIQALLGGLVKEKNIGEKSNAE
tara:strand:- start:895 stop:1395 length:501 start_codon:yes stop_codon:yes gene_type:complete